jgi:uncharacterized protein YjiS (DUF1127 family)
MVTIFYIAPEDESIDMKSKAIGVQFINSVDRKMNTIDTFRYDATRLDAHPLARRGFVDRIVFVLGSFVRLIDRMLERRRSRLALLEMTDEQLKDIGVSRCDAYREGIRPFWD